MLPTATLQEEQTHAARTKKVSKKLQHTMNCMLQHTMCQAVFGVQGLLIAFGPIDLACPLIVTNQMDMWPSAFSECVSSIYLGNDECCWSMISIFYSVSVTAVYIWSIWCWDKWTIYHSWPPPRNLDQFCLPQKLSCCPTSLILITYLSAADWRKSMSRWFMIDIYDLIWLRSEDQLVNWVQTIMVFVAKGQESIKLL